MARQSNYIVRRGDTFSVRMMIPRDIRHLYNGSKEITRALGTTSAQEARIKGFYAVGTLLTEFSDMRTHGRIIVRDLSNDEVPPPPIPKDTSTEAFQKSVHSAKLFARPDQKGPLKTPTIMEAFEMYVLDNPNGITADTFRQSRCIVRLFSEFIGINPPVTTITRTAVREWRRALEEWPVKANEVKELKGYTFPEIILLAREYWGAGVRPCISRKTVKKYLSAMGGFCSWLISATDHIESNPVDGLHPHLDRNERKVFPFDSGQLKVLFNSPLYVGCKSLDKDYLPGDIKPRGARFWLPLIALFSGARLGEIAQLLTSDVKQLHGRWVIHITKEGSKDKRTKTAGSERVVPLHNTLISLGFLEYRNEQEQAGSFNLFPDVEKDARGQISGHLSRWFGRYMSKVGLRTCQRVTFHSFRHTATDALRRAGYTDEQIAPLLGHTQATMTGRYGTEPVGTIKQRA